ncbi:MAG: protein kinase domain-containing protein [Steroidobacteraceae bacterium]
MIVPVDRAQAYRIFSGALEQDLERRCRFVEQACNGNAALRAEVEHLLQFAQHDAASTTALLPPPRREADLAGHTYGRFRLIERIGEGGMGVVYRAERTDDVPQSVAIKLISAGVTLTSQARFAREVQTLARLEHPAVARLIDAGVEGGRAWIAMEFVRGERIDDYCAARQLGPEAIVGLLVQLADAVAAAHRMLVVHSDIKPANVLVTAEGVPKLIDFGIATALRDVAAAPAATVNAARLFSPGFAAPEQIQGAPLTVATDVYGLGALAYRLLTGAPTFPDSIEPVRYMLAIAARDVELPSRAALAAKSDPLAAGALRGDLDAILCKALERNPARRYASAKDMQDDLKRYLMHRPVFARAPTLPYRLGKFVRRHTLAVSLVGLLLLSVITAGSFIAWQARRVALAHDMAARRGEFLESLLKSANPDKGRRDISVAELLDSASQELDRKFGSEPLVEASMLGLIAQTNTALSRFPEGQAANDKQLEILRTRGGSALEIGQALTARGQLLRGEGKWTQAELPLREAIGLLRASRSPADLCAALHLLGITLAHTQREKEAEATFFEEIAIESRGDRQLQQQRMYAYDALAVMMGEQGRYSEAVSYNRQALELARQSLPPDHIDLLGMQTTYGSALVNTHQAAAAETVFRDVLAKQTQLLGAGHHDTLLTQLVLADALIELHRDAEAAQITLAAARRLDATLGPENLYTLMGWQEYGSAACNNHQEGAGLAALRQVEATRERILPAGNWLIYRTGVGIGICLYRAKRYAEAESALLAAVAGLEAARGPNFRRTQEAYRTLRDLYTDTGRPGEAARWAGKIRL